MKSYNHLFEKLVDNDNVSLAIKESARGKHDRITVQFTLSDMDKSIHYYQRIASCYKNANHKPREIYDGIRHKKRKIIVPMYHEQVIHHMVVNVLKPIMLKGMYEHSYGSIPNKGAFLAKKYIEKWIANDIKNTRYCLQLDVQKFFDSIPHDVLKEKLSNLIHDNRFLKVLFEIIDVQATGLPLGFYTSQWLANYYLTDLDHCIKEKFRAKYYVRYMDDMVVFGSSRKKLLRMKEQIESELNKIGLNTKQNWKLFKIGYVDNDGNRKGNALDFMGFKFYREKTTLRKSIMIRMTRVARRIGNKAKATIHDCRRMMSYLGWIIATDTYNMYLKWIKPYVNFQNLKRRIGRFDRRQLCGKNQTMTICQA